MTSVIATNFGIITKCNEKKTSADDRILTKQEWDKQRLCVLWEMLLLSISMSSKLML